MTSTKEKPLCGNRIISPNDLFASFPIGVFNLSNKEISIEIYSVMTIKISGTFIKTRGQLEGIMKKQKNIRWSAGLFALLVGNILAGPPVEGKEAVLLPVDDEIRQVRVEAYEEKAERWVPAASGYRETDSAGWLKIAVPEERAGESLRVLVTNKDSPFAGKVAPSQAASVSKRDHLPGGGLAFLEDGAVGPGRDDKGETVIEEADIWAWEGDILYFYNQYRGLQVLDFAQPNEPVSLASHRYPARGENLYAFGKGEVLLIGSAPYHSASETLALRFLDFDGSAIELRDEVKIEGGRYMDSRRYGDYLYLLTREWRTVLNAEDREIQAPTIHLTTIALSGASGEERVVDRQSFAGEGWLDAVLTAQADGILLSLNKRNESVRNWRTRWHSEVSVLKPGEDGVPELLGTAVLRGVVRDKFKMNFSDGILTTLSQRTDRTTGRFERTTFMENFALEDGDFRKVGELSLAPGETLFATRFRQNIVYVVTFLFVDPLFAIDNSDPSEPKVAGELKVPGWSNYIEWVDDRLFAVGVEDRNLTVSMFDVADPANMSLLDRVALGEDSWARSEAQYDDQAISFFPEAGLCMLPFTTWSWERDERVQAMQLIEWDDTTLTLQGRIRHLDVPRRGILIGETVVTISGREAISTDVSDPSVPVPAGRATLAWNAQHLIELPEYLVQLEEPAGGHGYGWGWWRVPYAPTDPDPTPRLYVTDKATPNDLAGESVLEPGRVLGYCQSGTDLWLLQEKADGEVEDPWNLPEKQHLLVRRYDLTNPMEPVLTGETSLSEVPYLGRNFEGHKLRDGAVLWTSSQEGPSIYLLGYRYGVIEPWYGWYGQQLSYIVGGADGQGGVEVYHYDTFSLEDHHVHAQPWIFEEPYLLSSLTKYKRIERPEKYPVYEGSSALVAVDLRVPRKPVTLPKTRVPEQLRAVMPARAEEAYFLYFEPEAGMVDVWGWDLVNAFPLFEKHFYRKVTEPDNDSDKEIATHSLSWKPPFHVRQQHEYGEEHRLHLDIWYHEVEAGDFTLVNEETLPTSYPRFAGGLPPYYLVTGPETVYAFLPDAPNGLFPLVEKLEMENPQLFGQRWQNGRYVGDELFVPAGLYGVESYPLSPITITTTEPVYRNLEADNDGWRLLPDMEWELVSAEQSDAAGKLVEQRWLFRPDDLRLPDPGATDHGDYWHESAWLGWYHLDPRQPERLYHLEHGSLGLVLPEDPKAAGMFLYDEAFGYLWAHAGFYPWLFAYEEKDWLYYAPGSGLDNAHRWFFRLGVGWFQLEDGTSY